LINKNAQKHELTGLRKSLAHAVGDYYYRLRAENDLIQLMAESKHPLLAFWKVSGC